MAVRLLGRTALLVLMTAGVAAIWRPARASVIAGAFAGIATSGTFQTTGGSVDVSGSAITGSFKLSSVAGAMPLQGGTPGEFLLPQGSISYSFFVSGINQTTSFGLPGTGSSNAFLQLQDNGTSQSVLLDAAFVDPSVITSLQLTGPEGSLFSSVSDLSSLHAGLGVSLVSPITLAVRFQGSASVTVTSLAIREPASWAILAGSVVVMMGATGRRWTALSLAS